MSADYSFYATLCGFMPRPEEVQKRETKVSRFFCCYSVSYDNGLIGQNNAGKFDVFGPCEVVSAVPLNIN